MPNLLELVKAALPSNKDYSRESPGIATWMMWTGELNSSIEQSFQDYGGTMVSRTGHSGLWFFFSVEAFMAIARAQLWAKMHKLDVSIVVMPATIYISQESTRSLNLDEDLLKQSEPPLSGFNIWVHPEIADKVMGIPGLVFEPAQETASLARVEWLSMYADSRLSYRTSFGWYCILRPLGNPLEKSFQTGWRNFFGEMENILQRQKFRYTIHDNFLLFPLDTLSEFRIWVREYFSLVKRLKEEESAKHYWPCVQAVVDKKGLVFNTDLPNKVELDWNQLMPDFPHMTFRNAYLLGEDFLMHDVRFETSENSINDWCNVSLIEEGAESSGFLPVIVPARLVNGKHNQCFYCGMRNHLPAQCPSRQIVNWSPNLWRQIGVMDFDTMNSALREIDQTVREDGVEGMTRLLKEGDNPENQMLRAVFDINAVLQHHMMPRIWLSHSRNNPRDAGKYSGQQDDNPIWRFLEKLPAGELIPLEKELQIIMQSQPRDWRLLSLNGFLALDRSDPIRAAQLWKDGEGMSANNLQSGYFKFLLARLLEIDGKYEHAGTAYAEVSILCPNWLDPLYRQVVCMVKMGFAEQAMPMLMNVISQDPNFFNKALLDPEMERGHIQLQRALYQPWVEAEETVPTALGELQQMRSELSIWFKEDHPFAEAMSKKIDSVLKLSGISNYVPYQRILRQKVALQLEKQDQISVETAELRTRLKLYRQRLERVQEEAAWFPFPRLLGQFNKVFNSVAQSTVWGLKTNLQNSENFKKALQLAEREEERLKKLESQIRFLKIVRDSTLFVLIMGKLLIWLELAVLLLVFVGLPLLFYYSEKNSFSLISGLVFQEQWQLQKALVIILSVMALAVAALRTASVFEKRRDKLLKKGKEKIAVAKK